MIFFFYVLSKAVNLQSMLTLTVSSMEDVQALAEATYVSRPSSRSGPELPTLPKIFKTFVAYFEAWLGQRPTTGRVTSEPSLIFASKRRSGRSTGSRTRTFRSTSRGSSRLGTKSFTTPMFDFNVVLISINNKSPKNRFLRSAGVRGLILRAPIESKALSANWRLWICGSKKSTRIFRECAFHMSANTSYCAPC